MLHKHCRVLQKPSIANFFCDQMVSKLLFLSLEMENGIEIKGLDDDLIIELEQRWPLNPPTGIPTWVYQ